MNKSPYTCTRVLAESACFKSPTY